MSAPAPSSSAPPRLTDRPALQRNRARAARTGREDWLHALVLDEIQDRLSEINRRFTAPAVVTGHPAFWSAAMSGARVVPDEAVLDLEQGAHDLVIHVLALHWAALSSYYTRIILISCYPILTLSCNSLVLSSYFGILPVLS